MMVKMKMVKIFKEKPPTLLEIRRRKLISLKVQRK
jgi:hypothetical protein